MAKIEVNHQTLLGAADAIDNYCKVQDQQMKTANAAVDGLINTGWVGKDALAFSYQWDGVDSESSVAVTLRKNLTNYAESLRSCASIYRTAQEDSYNDAAHLPKHLSW